jgi:hypothetical protein
MKFGIITPVFDGCLESLELLFSDVMSQSHRDWTWIMCSNGRSDKLEAFVREKGRALAGDPVNGARRLLRMAYPRIIYEPMELEAVPDPFGLLANIGKRRDHCIRTLEADYLFMIDADAKLLDKKMFALIDEKLKKSRGAICMYKIKHDAGILPIFPIGYGRIDMLNFCVRADLAKKIGYPTTVNREQYGNDYWYFDRANRESNGDIVFIDKVFGQHNGNNRYTNLLKLL